MIKSQACKSHILLNQSSTFLEKTCPFLLFFVGKLACKLKKATAEKQGLELFL